MELTLKKLFDIWKRTCKLKQKEIIDAWDSGSWKLYTDIILGKTNNNSVLVDFCTSLREDEKFKDYDFFQEYYSCDAVFYDKDDCLKENPSSFFSDNKNSIEKRNTPSTFNQLWLKKIRIHFEHENDIKSSWHEIMQFCVISCEYHILVTYPNNSDEEEKTINCYTDILKDRELEGQLLVIFGYHELNSEKLTWKSYIWNRDTNIFDKND